MNLKQLRSEYNKNYKIIQDTLKKYQSRYTTKTNAALYSLMIVALEAELQNILYSLKYEKLDSSIESVKSVVAKYFSVAVNGNQSIAPTMKKFIGEIEYLFMEAVKIEYEYYVLKERLKEEQRALREQIRQEAADRKELQRQKNMLEKEESKFNNEITSLKEQLTNAADSDRADAINQRIFELERLIDEIESKKDQILNLQNGKAGHVYIISNLGSFGNNVFKIGMTRRLDPQERINELGDASVPFPFDVHSFIFSEDAVSLENELHKTFNARRLNKVNLRREFFKVSLEEIEDAVYSLQPSAEFNRTMLALQYNQSLSIEDLPYFDVMQNQDLGDSREDYADDENV